MNNYELIKLNTARNCLRYVIRAFNIKEIYIPYYICPVLRVAINKENCKLRFYHISQDFRPVDNFPEDAFILYPNYFGVCSHIVDELNLKYKNLIVDNAHSFYSEPKGIASFSSVRKFFPKLRDGAFLYTKQKLDKNFERDNFFYEVKTLSYEEICKNEERLDKEEIKIINPISDKSLILDDRKKRIEEIEYFKAKLDKINNIEVEIKAKDFPFCYPFLAKDEKIAQEIVSTLEVEPYRYWNNMPDSYEEKIFYTNLVAIPLNTLE